MDYRVLVFLPGRRRASADPIGAPTPRWSAGWRRRVLDSVAQLVRDRAPQRDRQPPPRTSWSSSLPGTTEPAAADLGTHRHAVRRLDVPGVAAHRRHRRPLPHAAGASSRSYAQARRAAEVALRFGRRGEVVSFEDLGLYRLLFQISDREELRAFVEQVLGPLLEYDQQAPHRLRADNQQPT